MSRITAEKINFTSPILIKSPQEQVNEPNPIRDEIDLQTRRNIERVLKQAELEAQSILEEAQTKAQSMIEQAQEELTNAQNSAEILRENSRSEGEKEGFQKGYDDGQAQILGELDEKIKAVDLFAGSNFEMKQKILKSAEKDAVGLCIEICRKVCHKALDKDVVVKIVEKAFSLIQNKEEISIIISPYLGEMLGDMLENKFENIKVHQNPKIAQDAIIVEALSDRIDCSVSSQIDEIANAFLLELGKSEIGNDSEN